MGIEDESTESGKMPEKEERMEGGLRRRRGREQGRRRVWLGEGEKPSRVVGRNEGGRERRERGGIRRRERDSEPPDGERHEQ